MYFTITNVEILKRRSKSTSRCTDDWKSHAKLIKTIFQNVMEEVGCRAPYQQSETMLPMCQTKEQMRQMYLLLSDDPTKNYPPSCDTLENLQFKYDEADYALELDGANMSEYFKIYIDMPNRFKEIIQTRAVDVHMLVGNCGGYIGLFVGECIVPHIYIYIYI